MARFELFIWDREGKKVPVQALKATRKDLETTLAAPIWQTNWTTEYITESGFDIYALKTQMGELVALGANEIGEDVVAVHIVYIIWRARLKAIRLFVKSQNVEGLVGR